MMRPLGAGDANVSDDGGRKGSGVLLTAAAFVVVVAGMRAAKALLVPFLLAIFLAVIATPAMNWLRRRGLPTPLAMLVVLGVIVGSLLSVGSLVATSARDFTQALPSYDARLDEILAPAVNWLQSIGIKIDMELVDQHFDPGKAMTFAANVLAQVGNLVANSFFILLTVLFILAEAAAFGDKLKIATGGSAETMARLTSMTGNMNRYMGIKTGTSLVTGVAVAVFLVIVGVDYPILWGLLAFLLNFVPNLGSILAAVPAVLVALVQLGPGAAAVTGIGYIVINVFVGSFLEPRIMGRGLGLSTLVVFLSLVFWGWVLGLVGMLLSVPLTMAVKIALEANSNTRWLAVLLGSGGGAKQELKRTLELRRADLDLPPPAES
jgi:predicted PurR-regulated permease PerM